MGSNTTPSTSYIKDMVRAIKEYGEMVAPLCSLRVVYGGNVQENNAHEFKKIKDLDGLLIGRASIDFQKLEKIVT